MSFRIANKLGLSRSSRTLCQASGFSTRSVLRAAETSSSTIAAVPKPKKRPIGGFRGGIFGFLLGATVSGSYGLYYLLEQYEASNALVLSSVNDLEKSTVQIRDYVERINALEAQLDSHAEQFAAKTSFDGFRGDVRKQLDLLNKDYLELKAHLLRLEYGIDNSSTIKAGEAAVTSAE